GPAPIEFLLHGLAACITAGIGNIAAVRGVTLTSVESRVEGDIDLLGILGLSQEVRNGYERIRISFDIAGDASAEKLRAIVEQGVARSAVFDVLTNGVPIVVGARCAGAATAMLLAGGGARVLLVDKGTYGTDMLSTHALMRGAVLQLDRWGVLPDIVASGTPPIRTTTFCYTESDATVPIEPKYGVTALYAPRRTLLDRLLVDAAFKSGVDIRYGVRVEGVKVDSRGRAIGISAVEGGRRREIDADIVIGADGLHSTIARQVRAPRIAEGRHATAVLYGYWEGLSADEYRWWFKPGVSMGSIPTNEGATCVFVSVPSARFRDEIRGNAALAYTRLIWQVSPRFAQRLHDSVRVEPIRGFGGHRGFIKRGSGPGWA